ncbi:MAG: hypothetical protein LBC73_04240 [Oscillospiraceae bacterium]|jgi:hypothetical protein|nr:hypothetical protein [Oscillospiraceae bacterium]
MICKKCSTQLLNGVLFCNICGEKQSVYNAASEQIPEQSQALYAAPECFTLDPSNGLYYMTAMGSNLQTGENGQWITWFYPDSGEFTHNFHPTDSTPNIVKPVTKKSYALPIVLPIVALFIGAAIAFFQMGGFALFQSETLPDVERITISDADLATLLIDGSPFIDDNSQGDDDSQGDDNSIDLFLDCTDYFPGEIIIVTVTGVTEEMISAGSFAAIYDLGAPHDFYQQYRYPIEGTSTLEFYAPTTVGNYEIRLYSMDFVYTDETHIISVPFTVSEAGT